MSISRVSTGLAPLDHVLGGGVVPASVVLLVGAPGLGKTILTLQALAGLGHACLYVTGEETQAHVAETARRIGARSPHLFVLSERSLTKIFDHAREVRAKTIAIDSIQTMTCEDVNGLAGSVAQVKQVVARCCHHAKKTDTSTWLVGHVTGRGEVSGPKTIEHDVDVVLKLLPRNSFDGSARVLRCADKNRFGPVNAVGYIELTSKGFTAATSN